VKMPDLATHVLLPYAGIRIAEILKKSPVLSSSDRYLIIWGSIFPDLLDKGLPYTLIHIFPSVLSTIKIPSLSFLHTPFMLFFCLYVFSFLFPVQYRQKSFCLMGAGTVLHLALDLLQGNICEIGYLWFFPFSFEKPEIINLFFYDSTVSLVPIFIILTVFIEIVFRSIYTRTQ